MQVIMEQKNQESTDRFRMTSPNIPEEVKDIVKGMVLTVVATETPGAIDIVDEYDSTPLINAVMLPRINAVIKALNENPDDPIALKNFNETFDFYRMRKNDEN